MSESTLTREVALRIGLAARTLENTDAALLLKVLADVVGLPPSDARLAALKPGQLRDAPGGELAGQTPVALKAACAILNGERVEGLQLPSAEPYRAGEMPDSLRVACASNSGELIDGHFGSCQYFLIYQVSADQVRLVDVRVADDPDARDDRNAYRAALIEDAQVLFVASIGGPAAAKVVRAGVHPIKYPQGGEARQRLAELQSKIANGPPPWLAKAMGHAAETRVRFTQERQEA
jgi:nitrogen fixation protein NifX